MTRMKADRRWEKLVILRKRIAGLSASTLERFVLRARRLLLLRDGVNVLVTNSAELRSLNRRFRGADKPTDVLSFPSCSAMIQSRRAAGDVAISADIARDNAKRLGHSLTNEIKILALHGILHLAGFDHEKDDGQMARKEIRMRRQLKLESGLIERIQTSARNPAISKVRENRFPHARRRTA